MTVVGPIYPLSQTGIISVAGNLLPHGFWTGSSLSLDRKMRTASSSPSALPPCAFPPSMMGCWGFLGGFCGSCGSIFDGHDVDGLLPRLARILIGELWLLSKHEISIPIAGNCLDVDSPLMESEIRLNLAALGPSSSVDIDDDPVRGLLVWS